MIKKEEFTLDINGKELKVIFNDLVGQANGSCFVQYGETTVLATVAMSKTEREDIDFFPLSVEYQEKYYAAGKILGSRFIRRETRPSEEAVLTARAIDRSIRPQFPAGFKREVQIIITCLSWDGENDPDTIGLIAASLALSVSDIPFGGPLSAVRIGKKDGSFILNPSYIERAEGNFEILLAGLEKDNEILINMIEAESEEFEEKDYVEATKFGNDFLKKINQFQKDIKEKIGVEKIDFIPTQKDEEFEKELNNFLGNRIEEKLYEVGKGLGSLPDELFAFVKENYPEKISYTKDFLEKEVERIFSKNVLKNEKRPDGRKVDELRQISFEADFLPRTHGTGIFRRGETKSLSILTLGAPGDSRLMEGMEIRGKKRFMHHYNFPPYCVGEVKPLRGPGRREIGHGMLAEKALFPLIPNAEEFPYTIRIVTEILSSNGSSSMASVSSSSLALMDAGVPIKAPAAGIAMGIVKESNDNYKILTDIQGPEDHYGGMDFKVAGTEKGITAIQMDVKIDGLNMKMIEETLIAAKKARLGILDIMKETIREPRKELSSYAPKIFSLKINPEKIGAVIGTGGKTINKLIEQYEVEIDIDEDGTVFVTGENSEMVNSAIEQIKGLTEEVELGKIYQGKVIKIVDFGAFVEILPGQEGLLHISQLAEKRVEKVEDIIKAGEIIPVKVISIDTQNGKISLSLKEAKKANDRR